MVSPREEGEVPKTAREISSGAGFTPSQQQAFDHMVANRLTLVWGGRRYREDPFSREGDTLSRSGTKRLRTAVPYRGGGGGVYPCVH
ncbi:hypothetical protein [Methanogenium cariaci]|uniref:hypothetical protein n=1 Tax=Methanogenium cariaci TaxID=2197 RepID=UPI0007827F75|nr:hypothetical protein [Methanogenium cariaci]